MSDKMTFPETWEEYEKQYGFADDEEVYTNGSRLIPSFRVKQWLDHLPSAEPERLTDDDFETIRIHLNAQKEKLCNQQRWEEAEEYQRIIDRFMAFASAQPEIIRCGQCKYAEAADSEDNQDGYTCQFHRGSIWFSGSYCSWAERREECTP